MLTSTTLIAFAVTSLVIELTPGPNMAYLALLSASQGRRAGLAATAGVAVGLLLIGIAAALGVATIIANSRWAYEALRWAGALYLLWLALETWRPEAATQPDATDQIEKYARHFYRGVITNVLNPKAAIFYITVLPNFVDATQAAVPQTLTLSAVYVGVATLIHASIVILAGSAQALLTDSRRIDIARRVFAVLLAAVAIWLLVATRKG